MWKTVFHPSILLWTNVDIKRHGKVRNEIGGILVTRILLSPRPLRDRQCGAGESTNVVVLLRATHGWLMQ